MLFRMPSVSRRADSSYALFRQRVPRDVLARALGRVLLIDLPAIGAAAEVTVLATVGNEVKCSLRTRDPATAKARNGAVVAHLEKTWTAIRSGPSPLTHKQVVALAGDIYRHLIEVCGDNPGHADNWRSVKGFGRAVVEGRIAAPPTLSPDGANEIDVARAVFGCDLTAGIDAMPRSEDTSAALETRYGLMATWTLMRRGIEVDPDTRARLLLAVHEAVTDAAHHLKRNAVGDYTPDPRAARYPTFVEHKPVVTLTALFDAWQSETKPSPNSVMTWRGCFRQFREFLGHDDAGRVTQADVIRWKDSLLTSDRKPKTVNDSQLTALRSIFSHAVRNKVLPVNPAVGVRAVVKAVAGQGALPYDDDEVARLLDLASRETNPYKRWLPLLAAATGARIGELAQLHGSHVVKIEGIDCLRIEPTADGGRLKNVASERIVPLHTAVIEAGFLAFVQARGQGPLFYKHTSRDPDKRHASKGVANHTGEWIRAQGFDDPRKAPSHGLRHWFKSTAFRAGVQDSVADHIQGHAAASVASRYRHFDIATLAKAVAAIVIPGSAAGLR